MAALVLSLILAAAAHPCQADADRLCKGVEPGGGRIVQCLKQHQTELSQACKDKQKSFRERAEEIRQACKGDVEQFCGGVVPGRGAIARCLRGHAPQLSAPCKKDLEEVQRRAEAARAAIEKTRIACATDEQRFCLDEDVGGGGLARCLNEHQQSLSLDCKRALAEFNESR
ncbi:MAG: hypothetical protein ACXWLR_04630 [Myxococcales bacterium]